MRDKGLRRQFEEWLAAMDKETGLLCFCRSWKNPVLWSHYAQNHSGVCYGFDVDPAQFVDVRYVSERLHPNLSTENFFQSVGPGQMTDLFATKFIHWSYEEEVRLLIRFSESVMDYGPVFHPFSASMRLKQVIVGSRSKIRVPDVEVAIADRNVEVFKTRLAFQRFEVVRQNDKSLW